MCDARRSARVTSSTDVMRNLNEADLCTTSTEGMVAAPGSPSMQHKD